MTMIHVVRVSCPDEKGLLAKVAGVLWESGLNILSNQEFVDEPTSTFFLRAKVEGDIDHSSLHEQLENALPSNHNLEISPLAKKNLVIMATKEEHVLGDLLIRSRQGDLHGNILAIVSNHPELEELAQAFKIPFYHLPVDNLHREKHEQQILNLIKTFPLDYLILAKYMRILSPEFVSNFNNNIINIHHSFLPAFIGANPYRQAHDRGVKIIGATAHFVNDQLDEGPIITQGVENVDHRLDAKDLARVGRNIEKTTLAKALDLVLEQKVFLAGSRTIVF
jgi:formyltetrahydrofolate deformylase